MYATITVTIKNDKFSFDKTVSRAETSIDLPDWKIAPDYLIIGDVLLYLSEAAITEFKEKMRALEEVQEIEKPF